MENKIAIDWAHFQDVFKLLAKIHCVQDSSLQGAFFLPAGQKVEETLSKETQLKFLKIHLTCIKAVSITGEICCTECPTRCHKTEMLLKEENNLLRPFHKQCGKRHFEISSFPPSAIMRAYCSSPPIKKHTIIALASLASNQKPYNPCKYWETPGYSDDTAMSSSGREVTRLSARKLTGWNTDYDLQWPSAQIAPQC